MSRLAPSRRFTALAGALLSLTLAVPAVSSAEDRAPRPEPKLHFEIPHALSFQKALHRVELLTAYWSEKYGVKTQWSGRTADLNGRVMGMKLVAHLEVKEQSVGGDVSDPGFFLRGTAKSYLHRKFTTYLDPKNDW